MESADASNDPPESLATGQAEMEIIRPDGHGQVDDINERPSKRIKVETLSEKTASETVQHPYKKGVAPIKEEYRVSVPASKDTREDRSAGLNGEDHNPSNNGKDKKKKQKKAKGQNTNRSFGNSKDSIALCLSRANVNEFTPNTCDFGDSCKYEHNIRKYLRDGKRSDLDTFDGKCPVFEASGRCPAGWRCRFVAGHSEERILEDGSKELVLLEGRCNGDASSQESSNKDLGDVNIVSAEDKIKLKKRQIHTPKADAYSEWLNKLDSPNFGSSNVSLDHGEAQDNRAAYIEPPFLPSEKRRIYFGPETPILAPLTTQGNLPFRRLCVDLGAQVTWSEMAMGLPLIQGEKFEWALMKAHASEITPPKYTPKSTVIDSYDNTKDLKFGAQIAGNKPWLACKTTEILTAYCPHLRAIDLNCGCPIDLVFRQGGGSALLDSPGKLEKILRGMNAVSNEVPVTVKIRMGTRDDKPTAAKLVSRLAFGGPEAKEYGLGPAGIAAITLHGRSRQQRYTRSADWSYISECAAVIQEYRSERDSRVDTIQAPDPRDLPASSSASNKQSSDNGAGGELYFIGNGDVFSHIDYYSHLNPTLESLASNVSSKAEKYEKSSNDSPAAVDAVMIARGALIKPWIFEEIAAGQYLDKSSSERLEYIKRFVRYGLQTWGSDEIGVGTTRRFLLEWLSFACRYVPVGLLEHLPPRIQDRPPSYRGRDEMETLMASDDYRDWIKISDMFLGPAHDNFKFVPKHKSSSYDTEAEG